MTYMLTSGEEETANEWEKYKGYTVRPLPSTCSYYFQQLKAYTAAHQCLMLGGTPEIRSIFQSLHLPVTIVDQSLAMVRAMGKLTQDRLPFSPREHFIEKNWLDIHSLNDKFDFIIGDDAINMVPWKKFDIFLKNIAAALNREGIFVCHLLVKPNDDLINMTFEKVVQDYFSGNIKSHYDLVSRLNYICYEHDTYRMGWQQTIRKIGEKKLNSINQYFNFIEKFGLCNSYFYCPPQAEFENVIEPYFHIEEIFYPHEHDYCLFEPVYVLKGRKSYDKKQVDSI